jgi:serine/threonine-protein kinase PpkA
MRATQVGCCLILTVLCLVSAKAIAKPKIALSDTQPASAVAKKIIQTDSQGEELKSGKKDFNAVPVPITQRNSAIIPAVATIPPGCFQMGSPESETGRGADEVLHRICIKGFKLAKYEVTVEEFSQFIGATSYVTDAENNTFEQGCWSFEKNPEKPWDWRPWASWRLPIQGALSLNNYPVTCVSYNDVMAFIEWLNKETGHEYRLPTEAEWEYAARAGTTTAHYWGNNSDIACGYANVADNTLSGAFKWPVAHSCVDGHFYFSTVKSYSANSFLLHDMLGNAWEWVCSKYEDKYTGNEEKCIEPKPDNESLISIRGGGWNADASRVRAAHRNWGVSWSRQANLGFRLVRAR